MENRGRKLSETKRASIRRLLREGMSVRRIARVLHVAASTVQKTRSQVFGGSAVRTIAPECAWQTRDDVSVRTADPTSTSAEINGEDCLLTERSKQKLNDPTTTRSDA